MKLIKYNGRQYGKHWRKSMKKKKILSAVVKDDLAVNVKLNKGIEGKIEFENEFK